jgi:O-antigen/teichoic acid export membrane protein
MSQIRKKSIKSTIWIYIGFLIGALNTYFLTHKQWFSTDQNGLTRAMIDIGQLAFAFSSLGATSFLFKFFPYYQDNLTTKKNDILGLALIVSLSGFLLTSSGLFLLKPLVVQKFSANSILLVEYFYWIIPMSFFILLYNLLESYAYGFGKGVITNLLKETVLRLYTLCIITLKILDLISFKTFIILFSFQYLLIVVILAWHLNTHGELWLSFRLSRVTRKFRKKIFAIMSFTFIVIVVGVLRTSIDALVLAAKQNLGKVGIFGLAAYMVSVLQAPFRSLTAITIPLLSRAWKDKNLTEINRIYQRTSINMLTFALFLFFCIWLNFDNGIAFFHINPDYLQGKWVFFILGMVSIIEVGTGVNGQIIGTSTYWRFELWTSLLLTVIIIPLSYYLTFIFTYTLFLERKHYSMA